MRITSVSADVALIASRRSSPETSGSFRSTIAASTGLDARVSSPARPLSAVRTVWPPSSRTSRSVSLVPGSSSTTRTRPPSDTRLSARPQNPADDAAGRRLAHAESADPEQPPGPLPAVPFVRARASAHMQCRERELRGSASGSRLPYREAHRGADGPGQIGLVEDQSHLQRRLSAEQSQAAQQTVDCLLVGQRELDRAPEAPLGSVVSGSRSRRVDGQDRRTATVSARDFHVPDLTGSHRERCFGHTLPPVSMQASDVSPFYSSHNPRRRNAPRWTLPPIRKPARRLGAIG